MLDVLKKISVKSQIFNNESEFQTYFWQKCKKLWYVYFKMSDFDTLSLKPCDCIITDKKWITHWIELKYTKTDIININKLEPQQKSYLKKVSNNWWSWLVIIYSKKEKSYIVYTIKDFLDKWNNVWTVNLFWKKLKNKKTSTKKVEVFKEEEMKDNIPL